MLTFLSGIASVQDGGRPGYTALGLPASGPLDPYAHAAANLLVGNPADAAALEIVGLAACSFRVEARCIAAVAGGDLQLYAEGRPLPGWHALLLRAGTVVELRGRRNVAGNGGVAYFAVGGERQEMRRWRAGPGHQPCEWITRVVGGFQTPAYLGSRSAYLGAAGALPDLCGRLPQPGDTLPFIAANDLSRAGQSHIHPSTYPGTTTLAIEWGPHADRLDAVGKAAFLAASYRVTEANRMGWRLAPSPNPALSLKWGGEIVSAPTLRGGVQLPPSGQPIILGPDQQTTGGYPLVAVVHPDSWPALGQLLPGDRLTFVEPIANLMIFGEQDR